MVILGDFRAIFVEIYFQMITISTGTEIIGDDDDVPDVEFFKPTLEYMGISWVCT